MSEVLFRAWEIEAAFGRTTCGRILLPVLNLSLLSIQVESL